MIQYRVVKGRLEKSDEQGHQWTPAICAFVNRECSIYCAQFETGVTDKLVFAAQINCGGVPKVFKINREPKEVAH